MPDEEADIKAQDAGGAENANPQEAEQEKEWFFELLSEMRI